MDSSIQQARCSIRCAATRCCGSSKSSMCLPSLTQLTISEAHRVARRDNRLARRVLANMPRCRLIASAALIMLDACHRGTARPTPVVCPVDSAPKPGGARADTVVRMDRQVLRPAPTHTLVVDDRIIAMFRSDADSAQFAKAWDSVNLATVKEIEIINPPQSLERYPKATGDVIRIVRCY